VPKTTSCCSARSSVADHHAVAGARLTASATGHSRSATRASASRRSRSSGSCQYIANVTASARAARNDAGSRATASAPKSLRANAAVSAAAKVETPADSGGSSKVQPPVRVSNSQHTRRPRGPAKRTSGSRAVPVTLRQVRSALCHGPPAATSEQSPAEWAYVCGWRRTVAYTMIAATGALLALEDERTDLTEGGVRVQVIDGDPRSAGCACSPLRAA
jgi:hypothetical protein